MPTGGQEIDEDESQSDDQHSRKNCLSISLVLGEVFIMSLWFLLESGHFCGIQWNLVELFLAEPPAKITILGTIYSSGIEPFRNWDQNGPGMDQNRNQQNAFLHLW